jgi:hypothetical protein
MKAINNNNNNNNNNEIAATLYVIETWVFRYIIVNTLCEGE